MQSEFHLLAHLGVAVPAPATASAPGLREVKQSEDKHRSRVWSPVRHPPASREALACMACNNTEVPKSERKPVYAVPTGEVITGKEDGEEVEFVIYNSTVPSIYGVNHQLAETRRKAAEERCASDRAREVLEDEEHERKQDAEKTVAEERRRKLLRELYHYNEEQARRREEEHARHLAAEQAKERVFAARLALCAEEEAEAEKVARRRRALDLAEACDGAKARKLQLAWEHKKGMEMTESFSPFLPSSAAEEAMEERKRRSARDAAEYNRTVGERRRCQEADVRAADLEKGRALALLAKAEEAKWLQQQRVQRARHQEEARAAITVAMTARAARMAEEARDAQSGYGCGVGMLAAMERDQVRERERRAAEQEKLRKDLDRQIEEQRRRRQVRNTGNYHDPSASNLVPTALPKSIPLYRCPVTGQLLRAEAFDFSVKR